MRSNYPLLVFLIILFLGCNKDSDSDTDSNPTPDEPKTYSLTVTSSPSEGGSVSPSNGSYDDGTLVQLESTPSNGYLFKEWLGGVTGTENPISITMDSDKNITGVFEIDCESLKYPLIDLKQPSYYTDILNHPNDIINVLRDYDNQEGGYGYGSEKVSVDYDLDGYLDFISFRNDYDSPDNRQPIRFFKGTCSGEMVYDEENSEKFLGMVHGREILVGDYNNDDYPDIFFIGHGWDKPPFPGEYPIVLLSDGNGGFIENRLTQFVSFYHGGSSGDYDMDGDLDVMMVTGSSNTSVILKNDGLGNFTPNTSDYPIELTHNKYKTEFFDINSDGFLDLFILGPEGNGVDNGDGNNPTYLIYGNGLDFNGEVKILPSRTDFVFIHDVSFYDIDSNGTTEIIFTRTTLNYEGWYIQIVEYLNGEFIDLTEKYIENNYNSSEPWNLWIYVGDFERNGTIELRNSSNPDVNHQNYLRWELMGDKFIRRN